MLKKSTKRKNHRKASQTRPISILLALAVTLILASVVFWSFRREGEEGGFLSIHILALMAGTISAFTCLCIFLRHPFRTELLF